MDQYSFLASAIDWRVEEKLSIFSGLWRIFKIDCARCSGAYV